MKKKTFDYLPIINKRKKILMILIKGDILQGKIIKIFFSIFAIFFIPAYNKLYIWG